MYNEKSEKTILSIQEQINKFDDKANSLITIVGIVFALSLGILETFNQFIGADMTAEMHVKLYWLIALSILYFIVFAVEMIFLLFVIYPRRKKKGAVSIDYYMDAAKLTKDNIKDAITASDDSELESDVEQISTNAKICALKHKYLVVAIWLLVPLFLTMFATFLTAIL